MQYRLRTLLIVLALGPVFLGIGYKAIRDYLQRDDRSNPPPVNVPKITIFERIETASPDKN